MALEIDLKNKTALITGVSSGIGAGIAAVFAKAGANVSGSGLEPVDSKAAQGFIANAHAFETKSCYTKADLTLPADLEKLVQHTVQQMGGIDILVSNAGANYFKGAATCLESDWQENMDLNLKAHWKLACYTKPYLEKTQGVIIIISSNHAFSTMPGCFPYNISKTALTGLVRSLAIEWGPAIRTVGLAPGFIDTPANQQWFDAFPDPVAEKQKTIDRHPVKKMGSAAELGAWCAFLASEYAAFASGTTYLIDGGRSALMQDE